MHRLKGIGKDHWGAALLVVMGALVAGLGVGYRIGTLNRMGPGFVPVVLGVLMVAVGIAIALTATPAAPAPAAAAAALHAHAAERRGSPWRGWLCILGGVFAFVVVGRYGGLAPASFVSVFVAALGDRQNTVKGAAALGAVMVAAAVAVFHYALQLQLDLFAWP